MKTIVNIEEVDNGYIIRVSEESSEGTTNYTVIYRTPEEVRHFLADYYASAPAGSSTTSSSTDPEPSDRIWLGEFGSYPVIRR